MEDYSKGIKEARAVEIGGIRQWISIRGEDINAPILLVIHGGPGSTLTGISHVYQRPWEKLYTVVNWDQRCSGKTASISGSKTKVEITFDMMINDALEVTDYIRNRFNREKILILGHSWGTMLGAELAMNYPERYIGYISTGTMVNSKREHQVVTEELRDIYIARKDKKGLESLEKLESEEDIWKKILGLNKLVIDEGFSSVKARGKLSAIKYEVIPMLKSPEYSIIDTLHVTGFNSYIPLSTSKIYTYNLEERGYKYDIPVYYINGDTDWQTPYVLAKEYAAKTIAPDTEFYTLENCAHCWDVDAPDQMADIMCNKIYERIKKYF